MSTHIGITGPKLGMATKEQIIEALNSLSNRYLSQRRTGMAHLGVDWTIAYLNSDPDEQREYASLIRSFTPPAP